MNSKYELYDPPCNSLRNILAYKKLRNLDESDERYGAIWMRATTLKMMKAVLETSSQLVLSLSVFIRSRRFIPPMSTMGGNLKECNRNSPLMIPFSGQYHKCCCERIFHFPLCHQKL